MLPPLGLSAKNLKLDLKDSCNCCRCESDDCPVYVDSKGNVVKFDPQKAQDEQEALARSLAHLQSIIDSMLKERDSDRERLENALKEHVVVLQQETPHPITLSMIRFIKRLFSSSV